MPTDKKELAYLSMRHFSPATVRNIRLLLDLGETPAKIKRLYKGERGEECRDAIDYMAANPYSGVCKWDGMRWTWREG